MTTESNVQVQDQSVNLHEKASSKYAHLTTLQVDATDSSCSKMSLNSNYQADAQVEGSENVGFEIHHQTSSHAKDQSFIGNSTNDAINLNFPQSLSNFDNLNIQPLLTGQLKQSTVSFAPKFAKMADKSDEYSKSLESSVFTDGAVPKWDALKTNINTISATSDANTTPTALGMNVLEEDGSLNMFWIDAQEINGIVYVFGKVKNHNDSKFVSCCLSVQNSMRNLFLLPRPFVLDGKFESFTIMMN